MEWTIPQTHVDEIDGSQVDAIPRMVLGSYSALGAVRSSSPDSFLELIRFVFAVTFR